MDRYVILRLQSQYRENEKLNLHCDNYVLLAENFGDFNQRYLANLHSLNVREGREDRSLQVQVYHDVHLPLYNKLFPDDSKPEIKS